LPYWCPLHCRHRIAANGRPPWLCSILQPTLFQPEGLTQLRKPCPSQQMSQRQIEARRQLPLPYLNQRRTRHQTEAKHLQLRPYQCQPTIQCPRRHRPLLPELQLDNGSY
jgi:hypothetical protein